MWNRDYDTLEVFAGVRLWGGAYERNVFGKPLPPFVFCVPTARQRGDLLRGG